VAQRADRSRCGRRRIGVSLPGMWSKRVRVPSRNSPSDDFARDTAGPAPTATDPHRAPGLRSFKQLRCGRATDVIRGHGLLDRAQPRRGR
jgi:hypothetical protein